MLIPQIQFTHVYFILNPSLKIIWEHSVKYHKENMTFDESDYYKNFFLLLFCQTLALKYLFYGAYMRVCLSSVCVPWAKESI